MKKTSASILIFILSLTVFSSSIKNLSAQSSFTPSNKPSILHLDAFEYNVTFKITYATSTRATINVAVLQDVNLPQFATGYIGYFQKISNQTFSETPELIFNDSYGNLYARFNVRHQGDISIKAKITVLGSSIFLKSSDIGGFNEIPPSLSSYTKAEQLIESDNPKIISEANKLKAGSNDIYEIISRVFNFTYSHITYTNMTTPKGALWALENGKGDCTEYSTLMVALLRALGIPARVNVGAALDPATNKFLWHAWAEVFMPKLGWIPFDPTWNLFGCWRHVAFLRSSNELQGPFILNSTLGSINDVVSYDFSLDNMSAKSFSDYIYVNPDGTKLFKRAFSTVSSNITIPSDIDLNSTVTYSYIFLHTRTEIPSLITSLQFIIWNQYTPADGYKILIEGSTLNFILYQSLKQTPNIGYNSSSTSSNSKPVLNLSVSRTAEGAGYVFLTVYYMAIAYLVLYIAVILTVIIVIAWYMRRVSRKVKEVSVESINDK